MTRHLLIRTRMVRTIEVLEVDAPSEEFARLKAAELSDPNPETTVIAESLEAAATADLDQETVQ